jgi:hypothetical protein
MLPNWQEYPCQVIDMSPGRCWHHLAGHRQHRRPGGCLHRSYRPCRRHHLPPYQRRLCHDIKASKHKRDKLASQLTYLANKEILDLPEDRRHERQPVENPYSRITMPMGASTNASCSTFRCLVRLFAPRCARPSILCRPAWQHARARRAPSGRRHRAGICHAATRRRHIGSIRQLAGIVRLVGACHEMSKILIKLDSNQNKNRIKNTIHLNTIAVLT